MPRRVRKTPWSRTGCSTCKRRRKKCDGHQPKCHACVRLGLECEQFDAFCPVNVVKPTREAVVKLPAAEAGSGGHLLTLPILTKSHQRPTGTGEQVFLQSASDGLMFSRFSSSFPTLSLSDSQTHLLQYYLDRLSGVLVNADSNTNPLRSLILPRVASSRLLLDAVCATSAVHQSTSAGSARDQYLTLATRYYVRVLSAVGELIPRITASRKDCNDLQDNMTIETAVLASVFLCKYEIVKDGVENWRHHLMGIESMCGSLSPEQMASMSETIAFVRSFMTYHKCIASITEGTTPASGKKNSSSLINDGDQLAVVDPYMGFSQSLITLLRRVTGLTRLDTEKDRDMDVLRAEVQSILNSLNRKTWRSKLFTIPEGMSPLTIRHCGYVAEAYKSAVLACVHAVIDEMTKRDADGVHTAEWASLHEMVPRGKAEALTDCLEAVSLVPLGCPEEAGLLPLLFIVACETKCPEQTTEALQRVEALGSNIGLGNVRYTSALLREVVTRRKMWENWHDWRGLLATAKWDLIIT